MTIDRLFSIAATAILSAAFISVMAAPAAAADCTAANTGALFCWETKLPIDPRAIAALEGVPALDRTEVWACAPDRDGGVRCAPRVSAGSDNVLRTGDDIPLGGPLGADYPNVVDDFVLSRFSFPFCRSDPVNCGRMIIIVNGRPN